jgi:hypothetical protein
MSLNVLAKAVKDGDLKIVYAFMNNITAKNIVSFFITIQKVYGQFQLFDIV